ncbi:hypothetical protein PQR67_30220 [Paraburkholderia fungorum]|uniref:hypothetical protein n=1 Tax=Paraburkholderia fungorum TaxID=134537 RepID=UPI0038BCBB47
MTKAQAKAARKAQCKQARVAKNAERKKLKQNGYGPQDYPQLRDLGVVLSGAGRRSRPPATVDQIKNVIL